MRREHTSFGWLDLGIVALTLATAVIHAILAIPDTRVPFYLNALGYLALLAALYLPLAPLAGRRPAVRWTFIGYTLLTLVLWLVRGERTPIAYADKAIEVALLGLLRLRRPTVSRDEQSTAAGPSGAAA